MEWLLLPLPQASVCASAEHAKTKQHGNMAFLEDGTVIPLSEFEKAELNALHLVSEVNPHSQLVSLNKPDQLRPWLGVVTKSVKLRNFPEIDRDRGLMLVRVLPNSPAEQAGLAIRRYLAQLCWL